jgi:hypothetical protein
MAWLLHLEFLLEEQVQEIYRFPQDVGGRELCVCLCVCMCEGEGEVEESDGYKIKRRGQLKFKYSSSRLESRM